MGRLMRYWAGFSSIGCTGTDPTDMSAIWSDAETFASPWQALRFRMRERFGSDGDDVLRSMMHDGAQVDDFTRAVAFHPDDEGSDIVRALFGALAVWVYEDSGSGSVERRSRPLFIHRQTEYGCGDDDLTKVVFQQNPCWPYDEEEEE